MSIRSIAQLKVWFRQGKYPTEEQFADWMDSYVHKEESIIPMSQVEELPKRLNGKYDADTGAELERQHQLLQTDFDTHKRLSDEQFDNIADNIEETEAENERQQGEIDALEKEVENLTEQLGNCLTPEKVNGSPNIDVTKNEDQTLTIDSAALDDHLQNRANPHQVTAKQVGLGNVQNTSDKNKIVSDPQAAYIKDQTKDFLTPAKIKGTGSQEVIVNPDGTITLSNRLELFRVVDTLPATGVSDTIYLIRSEKGTETNAFEEWLDVDGAGSWENIGTVGVSVDLTPYMQFTDDTKDNTVTFEENPDNTLLPISGEKHTALFGKILAWLKRIPLPGTAENGTGTGKYVYVDPTDGQRNTVLRAVYPILKGDKVLFTYNAWGRSEGFSGNAFPVATTTSPGIITGTDKAKLDGLKNEWYGTQAEYDAIATKEPSVKYFIYE